MPAWLTEGLDGIDLAEWVLFNLDADPGRVASDPGVTEGQRAVYGLIGVHAMQAGGGFEAVLRFMSPLEWSMALAGADYVGATSYGSALADACKMVFPGGLPTDHGEEDAAWDVFEAKVDVPVSDPWGPLDAKADRATLGACLERFIRSHPGEFLLSDEEDDGAEVRLGYADRVVLGPDGFLDANLRVAERIIGLARRRGEQLGDDEAVQACDQRLSAVHKLSELDVADRSVELGHATRSLPDY